jgi:hypothetical protein
VARRPRRQLLDRTAGGAQLGAAQDGVTMFSIGRFAPADGRNRAIAGEQDRAWASFVFRDDLLVGANILGRVDLAAAIKRAIEDRCELSAHLARRPSALDVAKHLHELTAAT